ncbi:hypothetical protein [Curtobacterium sp. APC 4022]|uniref:hypothetical protein n=1 Tax=Curtobacterium sp. APC 4022 TaxID=3035201 RepID=UPI0025B2B29D|nr:hypothetical protein [Curtobacterium sp. APC 4022]MDN3477694.1 hypothetical protein [Curtobacterium sp. APC 4022]
MTPRTVMTIGAVALALVVGNGQAVDHWSGQDADRAAAAEPTASATRTADPVPTWRPVSSGALKSVDAVELRAESIVFRSDDHTVTTVSMRDAKHTVSVLNRILGTPARTQTAVGDAGRCVPASTTSTWGGAIRVAALAEPGTAGNRVEVRVLRDHVRSRLGAVIELSGPDGVQVGDDVSDQIDDAPASDRESLGSDDAQAWQLLLQRGWTDDSDHDGDRGTGGHHGTEGDGANGDGANGVSVLTDDSTVTVIGSPMPIRPARGC